MKRENVNKLIRFFIVVIVVSVSLLAAYYLAKLIYPFLIALVIALIINPIVNFLEKKCRFPRALAVLTSIVLIIGLLSGLIILLVVQIIDGANYLAAVVPEQTRVLINFMQNWFTETIIPIYNRLASLFHGLDSEQQSTIIDTISNTGNKIAESATTFIQSFFLKLPSLFSWIPNGAMVLVFSLLATFFISKDWEKLKEIGTKIVPYKVKQSTSHVFTDLKKASFGFIKAQATFISITLVIVLIGLIILRVKYAITIALIAGVLDILPYLGTGTLFVPWIIYEVIMGNYGFALGLGILYTIVLVQRNLMEPKILASNIGMDPLATLISIFIGYKLFGFLGLIVGPVVLVILTTLHRANVFIDIWAYIQGKPLNK